MTSGSFRCAVYQFIVQFLRYFLAPIFELHEVRQVRERRHHAIMQIGSPYL